MKGTTCQPSNLHNNKNTHTWTPKMVCLCCHKEFTFKKAVKWLLSLFIFCINWVDLQKNVLLDLENPCDTCYVTSREEYLESKLEDAKNAGHNYRPLKLMESIILKSVSFCGGGQANMEDIKMSRGAPFAIYLSSHTQLFWLMQWAVISITSSYWLHL